ncbi:hypothetical protein H0I25_05245 [Cellulophaga sp. HaHa_2_95]|uniref:hypothetical protein n=1 Tax=unclassified Cellulophaga TaxID=2634405 RepID=UPI001C4EDA0C|nr:MULTISPECIES: hypothetical protein [unclassified Cellulophaga]QXP50490.1 hypothetical protein H0I24_09985 [Cellulophaga sp. HaHa_2_1]QXP57199.1 hypothetical protein H0I25_05245 [Cellulophaga sp. HaHa_2_95]
MTTINNIHKKKNTFLNKITEKIPSLFFLLLINISIQGFAQSNNSKNEPKKDTIAKANFLDIGAGTLGQLFGENLDGESPNKKLSFLEMLEKMDMPMEQKAEYANLYFLQAKELTEKQKDSLGKSLEKKIIEAKNNPEIQY